MTLDGKVAIVTGAARGIGAADVRAFVAAGAKVVATDVLDDAVSELAVELGGDRCIAIAHDVTDEGAWASVVERCRTAFGRVDVLVNNAAVHHLRPIEDEVVDDVRRLLDVNVVGVLLGIRAVTSPMAAGGGGSIINISSIAGLRGLPDHGAYGASKWAVRGLTQTAALELADRGIRVNSVHPGPVATAMVRPRPPGAGSPNPLGRVADPSEIADLLLYLASDASAFVTGAEIAIDGGLSVARSAGPGRRGA